MTDPWSAALFRDTLELIAEGVTELVGFEVAAVSVVEDDGRLEVVAVAGSEDCRDQLLGHRTPVEDIQAEIDNSESWGALRFVPHERMGIETANLGWIPDIEVSDDPNAWHPLDLLLAPFYDAHGELRGMMSMDVPTDGQRPQPEKRRQLQKYVEQAGRAVIAAHDRARLAEQVRLAETTREVIRRASAEDTLEGVFDYAQKTMIQGFNARGLWIRTFDEGGADVGRVFSSRGIDLALPPFMAELGERTARMLWTEQDVAVLSSELRPDYVPEEAYARVVDFLKAVGVDSMLFAPLGVGTRCLGNLVLTRDADQGDWSETEKRAVLDIGHDLGRTLLNTRNLERERRLNEELRTLDGYKSQLIATVSHELRNPLTSVAGYLELLDDTDGLDPDSRRAIASMARGVSRMSGIVEDLLTLSRAADPTVKATRDLVDLSQLLDEVVDLATPTTTQRRIKVLLDKPDRPVTAYGDRDDLDRVLTNLVGNAVKYSPEDSEVHLELSQVGNRAEFRCRDHGMGISSDDQAQLFTDFFRSTNPEAQRIPGTGLGLAIVKRIVDRYRGEIELESGLGEGSTFTVRLPAPAEHD
jgi:signal transduction histidine kinase